MDVCGLLAAGHLLGLPLDISGSIQYMWQCRSFVVADRTDIDPMRSYYKLGHGCGDEIVTDRGEDLQEPQFLYLKRQVLLVGT